MNISIIVAVAQNGVIGKNNDLVWHLPADLKFFKTKTTGHVIIMGRKTFESIGGGKPLPNRTTIVVSRNINYPVPHGVLLAHSLGDALGLCNKNLEVFICGGAHIYSMALSVAKQMYITRVHANFDGDTFFPEFSKNDWVCNHVSHNKADDKNPYDYSFETWISQKNIK